MRHGELAEVLPGLYFVTGTMKLRGPIRFSRNMTVVRRGERLVIVNSVRLDDAGLAALDQLGKVTDVVRLAAGHGMDDPFYAERYGAQVWAVKGQRYAGGFTPQHEMDATSALPIDGAKLIVIDSTPPEGLLMLADDGGTIISGDCLQHWARRDEYTSWPAGVVMRMMGFFKPYNIGPGWLKQCKPPRAQLRALADLPFTHVLTAHGAPVIGDAAAKYRPTLERIGS
ncbi:MAG: hypothetical protein ACM31C_10635 [Acidobacteriota bacterium]